MSDEQKKAKDLTPEELEAHKEERAKAKIKISAEKLADSAEHDAKVFELKSGDKVKTIHGEELEVIKVRKAPVKRLGNFVGVRSEVLAESGGHKCWFPSVNLVLGDQEVDNG